MILAAGLGTGTKIEIAAATALTSRQLLTLLSLKLTWFWRVS